MLFVFPLAVHAQVVINEIAWMGTAESYANEWIELYNTGANAVSLSGWTLTAADGSPSVPLEGSIGAGAYFLLERTDDTTVPGVSADVIYTGSLSNGGEALTLANASGTPVDTVTGGENWENIGGDNDTKHTAQRLASGGGWITAEPTPASANATKDSTPEEEKDSDEQTTNSPAASGQEDSDAQDSSASSGSGNGVRDDTSDESAERTQPANTQEESSGLVLRRKPVSTAIVHTSVPFSAAVYRGGDAATDASYEWNVGDGTVVRGSDLTHIYRFAGEYTVVLRASAEGEDWREEFTVTVVVPSINVASADREHVALSNDGDENVDLGGWALQVGGARFSIPADTMITAGGTITFASSVTNLHPASAQEVALIYPTGTVAVANAGADSSHGAAPPARQGRGSEIVSSQRSNGEPRAVTVAAEGDGADQDTQEATTTRQSAAAAAKAGSSSAVYIWLLALAALLGIAAAGVLMVRRSSRRPSGRVGGEGSTADEFTIEEEEADNLQK